MPLGWEPDIYDVIEVIPAADKADEQLSLDVHNIVWPHDRHTIDEERSYRGSLRDFVDVLALVDRAAIGSALGSIAPWRPDAMFARITVLPAHRRQGAGTILYRTISTWAQERGLHTVETIVSTDDRESLAFAQRRGFVETRRELGVALDLTRIESPAIAPPEGVEIVSWAGRPELARGMYQVVLEATPDIPGGEDEVVEPFNEWLRHDMMGPGDPPEATVVAVAGDEVIGLAKFSLSAAQSTTAHHDFTAVKRAWRGRGVGRALKATQIAWAKANGYEQLRSLNEQRNAPIRRLNEEFGYRPSIGRIYLTGRLAAPSQG